MMKVLGTLPLLLGLGSAGPQVGRIPNAWSYVWPAYFITWSGIALYSISLFVRRSRENRKDTP